MTNLSTAQAGVSAMTQRILKSTQSRLAARERRRSASQRSPLDIVGSELGEGVGGRFFETGEAAAEHEADFVGGAVTLLGDLNLRLVALLGRSVQLRPVGTIDKHDDVGVLLDCARLAKVGKLRATLFSFGRACELA